MRDGSRDIGILADIFARGCYDPPPGFPEPRSLLDLGANIGLFSLWARDRWPLERTVAVEPDPANVQLLRENLAVGCRLVEACAGTEAGAIGFSAGDGPESRIGGDLQVPVIDVFELGGFDLLKMDIEGGEWALLADPRFPRLAPTVLMEWHLYLSPDRRRARTCAVDALRGHGYRVIKSKGQTLWATS